MKFTLQQFFSFLFLSFSSLTRAHIAIFDEFWQKRAAEAHNNTFKAYVPNPISIVNHFNAPSRSITRPSFQNKYNNTLQTYVSNPEFITNHIHAHVGNNTRRNLRQHKRKFHEKCVATNTIDRCWRCRSDWARDRKRLARCAKGFGRNALGGLRGRFYVVTDPSDDSLLDPRPGTLRYGVTRDAPLWIIFAHDMVIKLQQELLINSYKTIDARGSNVHIAYGAGLTIQFVKHVIVHNLHIHHIVPGSGGNIRDSENHWGIRTRSDGDAVSIFGSSNIWIDHLSMYDCADGLVDAIEGSTAITISNCHMTRHDHVILFGANDFHRADAKMQATIAYNHFGQGLVQRMPRCRRGFFHVVNNDYTHWLMYAIGGSAHPTIISQGNRYDAPPTASNKEVTMRMINETHKHEDYDDWRKWNWRSEGDLFKNGAHFLQSGRPVKGVRFSKYNMIKAKSAKMVGRLTRFAGTLNCKPNYPC